MREDERELILSQVGGSAPDCALVCQVLHAVQRSNGQAITYGIRTHEDDGSMTIRLAKDVGMFTAQHARGLFASSLRVESIDLVFDKRCVEVHVVRDGETAKNREPWTPAFPRTVSVDYAASNVTEPADVSVIDGIVSAVYSTAVRMPNTLFWFEPIVDADGWHAGAAAAAARMHQGDAGDDASETTSTGGSTAPESARLGYSLCFSNMPVLPAAFFQHLQDTYSQRIASMYAWMSVPTGPALFVVNVRRASAPGSVLLHAVKEHAPSPLPTVAGVKRRQQHAAGGGGGDDQAGGDDSETWSAGIGERRSKRIRGTSNA